MENGEEVEITVGSKARMMNQHAVFGTGLKSCSLDIKDSNIY